MQAFLVFLLLAAPASDSDERLAQAMLVRSIRQLDDDSFEVRQRATELLWALGPAIVPALERARDNSPNAEVRLRSEQILLRFRYGIFAHTPESEVKLINRFRWGSQSAKDLAFQQLAKQGSVETLLILLETVTNDKLRFKYQESILQRLESDVEIERALSLAEEWLAEYPENAARRRKFWQFMRRQLPYLLVTQRVDQAELILRQAAAGEGVRDWAVYQLLGGKSDAAAKVLREQADGATDEVRKLAHLLRAGGDLFQARVIAQSGDDPFNPLSRGILFELRDWQTLSDLFHAQATSNPQAYEKHTEFFGYAAAFHRLAGQTERFDQAIQSLRSLAAKKPALVWSCGEALVVNGLVDEGISMLGARYSAYAFQLYCVQDRYGEAFRIAGIKDPRSDLSSWFNDVARRAGSRSMGPSRRFELALQVAKVLHQLGERDAASGYLLILAEAVRHERDARRLDRVCQIEARVGLTEQAYRHAAISLGKGRTSILTTLFPNFSQEAVFWHGFFNRSGADKNSPDETIAELKRLATRGALDPNAFRLLVDQAEDYARQLEEPAQRATALHAIGETCWRHKEPEIAEQLLSEAAESISAAALSLGERCLKDKQWLSAAQWYEKAWEQDRANALALYLRGHTLEQAGQHVEGERLMRTARLIPLADSRRRMDLARGLQKLGLDEAARQQWQLIMRSGRMRVSLDGSFSDTAVVDAQKLFGNSLDADPHRKAEHWESMHLSCLETQLWIPSMRGYFHTPHLFGKTRARAYLEDGQIDKALTEIARSRQLLPGNTELAEHLVPELEKLGQEAEADELFDESYRFIESICKQFPNSALHHNNLAWMSARCKRRLDEALRYSRRALELVPNSPSYLDTLGEVHFRRGEIQQAIACAQQCLEIEPRNKFFREQLLRFQRADQQ